jgi:peptidoglycan/LPS O-acetylase OafA/YrhL
MSTRLKGIEGVRALAAAAVVVYHVWLYSSPSGPPFSLGYVADQICSNLFVGVTLFFVLSGFLLYKPYVAAVLGDRPAPDWRHYLSNRALRILPAYWAVLLVVAFVLRPSLAAHPLQLLANGAFFQNYVPSYMPASNGGLGIVPAWSLANEVIFYLLLPLLGAGALLLRRSGRRPLAAVFVPPTLLLVAGVVSTLAVGPAKKDAFVLVWRASFLPHAGWFAVGMVLAVLRVLWEQQRLTVPRAWPYVAVAATAIVVLPSFKLYANGTIDQLEYEQLLAVGCALLLSVVVLPQERSRSVAMLSSPAFTAVGLASYSLFLWHDPLVRSFRDAGWTVGGGWGAFAANLLLVGAVAGVASAVTYRFVEKPALARKRSWQGQTPSTTGAAVGTLTASGDRSSAQNEASITGPTPNANSSVPMPNVPPSTIPTTSAQSSSVPRTSATLTPVRRVPTSISVSRGPAPKSAPM